MILTSEVTINKPIKEVFDFITDAEQLGKWLSGLVEFEILSGKVGEVGAETRQVFQRNGKRVEFKQRITEIIHQAYFEVELSGKDMDVKAHYKLESEEENITIVKAYEDIKLKSFLFRSFKGMVRNISIARQAEDLNSLKNVLENE